MTAALAISRGAGLGLAEWIVVAVIITLILALRTLRR
jgi:Sec-independent protein translocase protein TatA